jgi:hypothetical protein
VLIYSLFNPEFYRAQESGSALLAAASISPAYDPAAPALMPMPLP